MQLDFRIQDKMSHDSHMTLKEQWYQAGNTVDLRKRLLVV